MLYNKVVSDTQLAQIFFAFLILFDTKISVSNYLCIYCINNNKFSVNKRTDCDDDDDDD